MQRFDPPPLIHFDWTGAHWKGAYAPDEVVFDRTFPVQSGEHVAVDVRHADVRVASSDVDNGRVQVVLRGRDMEQARAFLEHLNFTIDYESGDLSIRTDPRGNWNGSTGGAHIDVIASVPERFDADLDVAHGDVDVDVLEGTLAFDVAHGDLEGGSLSGSTLDITMRHGDVEFERLGSDRIRIDVQHGDLEVDAAANEIDVRIAHGDVEIQALTGSPRIRAEHGDISVRLTGNPGGAFENRHGDIDLRTGPSVGADIDFEGSDVDVSADYVFEGSRRDKAVSGRINGGGARLTARTTHGDVNLTTF